MESLQIAIIGGGPAGLMLARLLKLQGVSFKLFELDESRLSRSQGGTLDIHSDSGQLALEEGQLLSQFNKYARYEGEALVVIDKTGTVAWDYNGSNDGEIGRPEIDRELLRTLLLDSLDDGMITWGKKAARVEEDSGSTETKPRYNIVFTTGEIESGFELVVGGDGTWSKVRPLLTDVKPFYSGITAVETWIENIDTTHPDLAKRLGLGSIYQFSDAKGLISQRQGDGSARTYAMLRVPEDWSTTCDINWADDGEAKRGLIDRKYSDWEQLSKDFVLRSDGSPMVRPLYMLPIEMHWKTRPGVTVIGDAAHVMTPFAGIGVNLALTDALDLSHAIRSHVQDEVDWATALQQFEHKMQARAQPSAAVTYSNLTLFFSQNKIDAVASRFKQLVGSSEGEEKESSTDRL